MRGMTVRFFFTLGRNANGNNRRLPPKLLYYFLSLCKTFNELFHLPPPFRSGHTRPCFPKASAKVQPFNVTAKRFANFFPGQPRHKDTQTQPHGQETRCKTRVLQQETPNTLRENFFSEWKEVDSPIHKRSPRRSCIPPTEPI